MKLEQDTPLTGLNENLVGGNELKSLLKTSIIIQIKQMANQVQILPQES